MSVYLCKMDIFLNVYRQSFFTFKGNCMSYQHGKICSSITWLLVTVPPRVINAQIDRLISITCSRKVISDNSWH